MRKILSLIKFILSKGKKYKDEITKALETPGLKKKVNTLIEFKVAVKY